ncbi:MAG: hypothetical protein AAF583_10600 [Pseudomonadota bacterium]
MPAGQGVKGIAGLILGDDLAFKLGAMVAMASRHGLCSSESTHPVNSAHVPGPAQGAHSNLGSNARADWQSKRCTGSTAGA